MAVCIKEVPCNAGAGCGCAKAARKLLFSSDIEIYLNENKPKNPPQKGTIFVTFLLKS
ncbi:hypothetical protein AO9_04135 [Chlamydia psittaci Mat116]|nr:hypothetical protein AO9_04135 [Chlamydia psittaci Mat116]